MTKKEQLEMRIEIVNSQKLGFDNQLATSTKIHAYNVAKANDEIAGLNAQIASLEETPA